LRLDASNEMDEGKSLRLFNTYHYAIYPYTNKRLGIFYDYPPVHLADFVCQDLLPQHLSLQSVAAYIRSRTGATRYFTLNSHDGSVYHETAKCIGGRLDILRGGDILPISNKSLGDASNYWNQAFIDAIVCSNSIDLDPTAGDAVIYFKHDGAANEASLRYDKVNKRLELWIDGAIVGYCNAALGWVNGPP